MMIVWFLNLIARGYERHLRTQQCQFLVYEIYPLLPSAKPPSPTSLHPTDQFQPVQKAIRPREMEGRDRFTCSHSSFSYLLAPRCHPSSVPLPGTLRRGANPGTALAAEAWRSPSARALWDREVFSGSWRSCGCRETRSIQPRLHQSPAHRGPCPLYALQASLRLVSAPTLP